LVYGLRSAMLMAAELKKYLDGETPAPMLAHQTDSLRQDTFEIERILSNSFAEKPPRFDVVFIDADIAIGAGGGLEDFFKRSRKLGMSVVFAGVEHHITQMMIENASVIVRTERNVPAEVKFADGASCAHEYFRVLRRFVPR